MDSTVGLSFALAWPNLGPVLNDVLAGLAICGVF